MAMCIHARSICASMEGPYSGRPSIGSMEVRTMDYNWYGLYGKFLMYPKNQQARC